ncbi:ubiquitinyl hydrolase 1 [Batrachochytrium dendrobatidis]|nr:ubiquitinyl hydrolase 1 [Batrachochytrium dendrobatidis]
MSGKWIPLESNPDVMNKYLGLLGVHSSLRFCDVWGLDPDLLQMIARPVKAVVLLFPITKKYEAFCKSEEAEIIRSGQTVSPDLYFVRQTIPNACGTIGLLHALINNKDVLDLRDGPLFRMLERTMNKTPDERAAALEADQDLAEMHKLSSVDGQTEVPSADDEIDLHFICFIEKGGNVYEMDGRKPFPINHGPTTGDLLMDSVAVIQRFMSREPEQVNFSILALAASQNNE